jgi:hypothetical protein
MSHLKHARDVYGKKELLIVSRTVDVGFAFAGGGRSKGRRSVSEFERQRQRRPAPELAPELT